jgi:hypothetical protein
MGEIVITGIQRGSDGSNDIGIDVGGVSWTVWLDRSGQVVGAVRFHRYWEAEEKDSDLIMLEARTYLPTDVPEQIAAAALEAWKESEWEFPTASTTALPPGVICGSYT